jgi:anti-sigma factor RsiW
MNENLCSYSNTRGETLVAYLYDDIAPRDRAEFERHLVTCVVCRTELDTLADVRIDLAQWAPPEVAGQLTVPRPIPLTPKQSRWAAWSTIPAWMQVAAAVLFLGVAAGLANLQIRYDSTGLMVTTGWQHVDVNKVIKQPDAIAATAASWHGDLEALEQKLRHEIEVRTVASPAPSAEDASTIRRVRALLDESEQRQQRELALRLAEVMRDTQVQRQADLVKIDRTLGVLQNQTSLEVMRTRREVNSLAQQVSQQR